MGNNFGIPVRNNTPAAYGGLTTQPSANPPATTAGTIPFGNLQTSTSNNQTSTQQS